MRAFFALPLPAELRQALARKGGAITGLRAQKEATIHLTIRFLGEIEDPDEVLEAIRPITDATAPFRFTLKGIGAFPNPRRARVAWVGVDEGAESAAELVQNVEKALHPLGFSPERRPWHAHVTLGRFRSPRAIEISAADRDRVWGEADATRLVLFRSELHPDGARHHVAGELSLPPVI
jgi:2'-5' RNA ligase